jgi:hypothetical protein
MTTVTQRTHREAEGPMGSHIEQDKVTSTSRDSANTQQNKKQTTSYQHSLPTAQQLIPNVSKQQMSLILPIVLAVILALALLSYRGSLHWPHLWSTQKTWKDHVSEGATNVGEGLKQGLNSAYDTAKSYGGQQAEYAQQKAAEAAEYAKKQGASAAQTAYNKAGEGAEYARQKAGEYATQAGQAAADAYERTKEAAADTYEAAKEKVAPHPTILGKASEYLHDKASQLYDSVKHTGHKTQEELKHEANLAAENARHAAAQMGNAAEQKYDNIKASAQDTKRDVKTKLGY